MEPNWDIANLMENQMILPYHKVSIFGVCALYNLHELHLPQTQLSQLDYQNQVLQLLIKEQRL